MIRFSAGGAGNPGAGGGGGAGGLSPPLPRTGNFDLGLISILHFTHSLSPVLNFSRLGLHLRDTSSMFIKATPLFINPSLEMYRDWFGWIRF